MSHKMKRLDLGGVVISRQISKDKNIKKVEFCRRNIFFYSHSSRCSSQGWPRVCVRPGLVRQRQGVVPLGSRALKAGCCRLGARRRLGGRLTEAPLRYRQCAGRRREAYTHLPPGKDTHFSLIAASEQKQWVLNAFVTHQGSWAEPSI